MGAKHAKIESPEMAKIKLTTLDTDLIRSSRDEIDPRSPNLTRTPINSLRETTETIGGVVEHANPIDALRRRLLNRFTYNLNDPRSPTAELNRTPLVLDNDRSLNLDDTFADLFIEAKPPTTVKVVIEPPVIEEPNTSNASFEYDSTLQSSHYTTPMNIEEETLASPAVLQQTPHDLVQQFIDPRSPSIGVERTPIVLHNSDDDAVEDFMLENVLGTLSAQCNDDSLGTPTITTNKLTNKPLESLRMGKVHGNLGKRTRSRCQNIYEDRVNVTPKKKSSQLTPQKNSNDSGTRRTPLGCVKNRTNLRSRSVEVYTKSSKEHLLFASQDDCVQMQ